MRLFSRSECKVTTNCLINKKIKKKKRHPPLFPLIFFPFHPSSSPFLPIRPLFPLQGRCRSLPSQQYLPSDTATRKTPVAFADNPDFVRSHTPPAQNWCYNTPSLHRTDTALTAPHTQPHTTSRTGEIPSPTAAAYESAHGSVPQEPSPPIDAAQRQHRKG